MRTPLAWQLSAGEAAAVEEGLLLRRADPAEHRIAVREAAEAADDIGVPFRPFQAVGVIARAIERDRPFLISEFLRMHEWQRSEEHTSELQSLRHLVCRLLL